MKTRFLALLTALLLIFSAIPAASAEEPLDFDELVDYLIEGFSTCPEYVDISAFEIPYTATNKAALKQLIWRETPELFHIDGLGFNSYNGNFYGVYASYHYTAEEYRRYLAESMAAADAMTADLIDSELGEKEKALLLHDRLALACTYDEQVFTANGASQDSYNLYGALIKGVAVCQGYTMAYDYLLKQVGIESSFCESDTLNHAWNVVYIDNEAYHVDVTWDDPRHDMTGRVRHTNFLLSTEQMIETHEADDFDSTPTSTTYDHWFWQNSTSAFQYLDGEIYYVDNENKTLNRYSDREPLLQINEIWWAGLLSYWPGNYTRLSTDGDALLFNTADTVYRYDPETAKTEALWAPDRSDGLFFYIYGFDYADGQLICDLYDSPNFTATTKALYQQRTDYTPPPAHSIAEVTLLLQDLNCDIYDPALDMNGDRILTLIDALELLKLIIA